MAFHSPSFASLVIPTTHILYTFKLCDAVPLLAKPAAKEL